jgi:PTH1 family peptidyl-tRNA hydrolase
MRYILKLFAKQKQIDPMKYLIVGLGNPGAKYVQTRHNVGFKVLDSLAEKHEKQFETLKLGDVTMFKFKGRTLILLKPNTFMNLSGKAVNYYMQKEKVDTANLLIITDDIALPFGKLRMKGKGSDGGHNGLKSIAQVIGTSNYARLRFGVGSEFSKGNQVDYVLGEWSKEEQEKLDERITMSHNFIKDFATIGLAQTMSNWNNK